jgi:hypothetical protein
MRFYPLNIGKHKQLDADASTWLITTIMKTTVLTVIEREQKILQW